MYEIEREIDFGIAYIKKNEHRVKITASPFRGTTYIHIREYGMDGDTGNLFPTKSGYAILAPELDTVINLLQKASKTITKPFKDINQYKFDFSKEEDKE